MKDFKISKELLSEVLKIPLGAIIEIYFDKTNVLIKKLNNRIEEHNIYEFAFKCKEWAFSQGYSYIGNNKLLNIYREDSQMICIANKGIINWFDINVDFIACEWILQQKDNK